MIMLLQLCLTSLLLYHVLVKFAHRPAVFLVFLIDIRHASGGGSSSHVVRPSRFRGSTVGP